MIMKNKQPLLFVVALVLIIFAAMFIYNNYFSNSNKKEKDILLKNVENIRKDIESLQYNIDGLGYAGKKNLKENIESEMKDKFKEDDEFLEKIILLKKKKMLAQLEKDIAELKKDTDVVKKSDSTPSGPLFIEKSNEEAKLKPSSFIKISAINYLNKSAVVTIHGRVQTVMEGDKLDDFIVKKLYKDYIVVGRSNGVDEKVYLNYDISYRKLEKVW